MHWQLGEYWTSWNMPSHVYQLRAIWSHMCLLPSQAVDSLALQSPEKPLLRLPKVPTVSKREQAMQQVISIHFLLWLWPHLVSMIDGDRSVSVNQWTLHAPDQRMQRWRAIMEDHLLDGLLAEIKVSRLHRTMFSWYHEVSRFAVHLSQRK